MLRIASAFFIATIFSTSAAFACLRVNRPGPYEFVLYTYSGNAHSNWIATGTLVEKGEMGESLGSCGSGRRKANVNLEKILKGKQKVGLVETWITADPEREPKIGARLVVSSGPYEVSAAQAMPEAGSFEEKIIFELANTDFKKDRVAEFQRAYRAAIDNDAIRLRDCSSNSMQDCSEKKDKDLGRLFSQIFWTEDSLDKIKSFCSKFDFSKDPKSLEQCSLNAAYRIGFSSQEEARNYCKQFKAESRDNCESAASRGKPIRNYASNPVDSETAEKQKRILELFKKRLEKKK